MLLDEIENDLWKAKSICNFHTSVYEGLNITEWDYQAIVSQPDSIIPEQRDSDLTIFSLGARISVSFIGK